MGDILHFFSVFSSAKGRYQLHLSILFQISPQISPSPFLKTISLISLSTILQPHLTPLSTPLKPLKTKRYKPTVSSNKLPPHIPFHLPTHIILLRIILLFPSIPYLSPFHSSPYSLCLPYSLYPLYPSLSHYPTPSPFSLLLYHSTNSPLFPHYL